MANDSDDNNDAGGVDSAGIFATNGCDDPIYGYGASKNGCDNLGRGCGDRLWYWCEMQYY